MSAILDYYRLRFQPFPQRLDDTGKKYETNDLKQTFAVLRYALPEMGISLVCGDTGRGVSYAVYCERNRSAAQTTPLNACRYAISAQEIFTGKHAAWLDPLPLAGAGRR